MDQIVKIMHLKDNTILLAFRLKADIMNKEKHYSTPGITLEV